MTCRHESGDPECSSHPNNVRQRAYDEYAAKEAAKKAREEAARKEAEALTPDKANYEIVDVFRINNHLVLKVLYPNCKKCSYEGNKILVFLMVSESEVIRWRVIDPHFRDPTAPRKASEAPPPAARFPASAEGWEDACAYARAKSK